MKGEIKIKLSRRKRVTIGVLLLLITLLFFGYARYQTRLIQNKKAITAFHRELTEGEIYQRVQQLSDSQQDYLKSGLKQKELDQVEKQLAAERKKKQQLSKGSTKSLIEPVDRSLRKLNQQFIQSKQKFGLQQKVNQCFIDEKMMIDGSEVNKNGIVQANISVNQITSIQHELTEHKDTSSKWFKTMTYILDEASKQATTIKEVTNLLDSLFDKGNPKADISEESYQKVLRLTNEVKNQQVKRDCQQKLTKLKNSIAERKRIAEEKERQKTEWLSLEEGLDFLKQVVANPANANYNLDSFISFEPNFSWWLKAKSGSRLDIGGNIFVGEGKGAGGGLVIRLEKSEDKILLTSYSGAFYPNQPDDSFEIDRSTHKVLTKRNLLGADTDNETKNSPTNSEVIEIFYTTIYPYIMDGKIADRSGFRILER